MTVMSDIGLMAWGKSGGVEPFKPENVQPGSLDLCVGPYVQRQRSLLSRWCRQLSNRYHGRYFTPKQEEMDLRWHPATEFKSLKVRRGDFFLLWTLERTCIPKGWSGSLLLKSTNARYGLEHLHAGWGDEGFNGNWVLEVTNFHIQAITIRPGDAVMQLTLHKMDSPANLDYVAKGGQYVNQTPAV